MKRRKLRMHAPYSEQRKRKVKGERRRTLNRWERRSGKKVVDNETEDSECPQSTPCA